MLRSTTLWKRVRRLRQQFQSWKNPQTLVQWPGPGQPPYTPWDVACHGKVITWETYLSLETRLAILDLHTVERLEDSHDAFWQWEKFQPLLERPLISHFEWTYNFHTVPHYPTFCDWLPRTEIETKVFPRPLPPNTAKEYERTKHAAVTHWTAEPRKTASLMFEEEATLLASTRLWNLEHYTITHFYRTLPYNPVEQQQHGRWVQQHD